MKVQEVVSSCIMFIVSGLVLVGFTIAWYTNTHMPAITGLEMQAVEMGHVKVALEPGGTDVSELEGNARYAEIVVTEAAGAEAKELGPGSGGTVTFYISPVNNSNVEVCDIKPILWVSQDNSSWHPGIRVGDTADAEGESAEEPEEGGEPAEDAGITTEKLYEIAGRHIEFFRDADMKEKISADSPYVYELDEGTANIIGEETYWIATIYWKWHYEYPFTEMEKQTLTTEQQKEKINLYDREDMLLGNHVSHMKFYFTFSAR